MELHAYPLLNMSAIIWGMYRHSKSCILQNEPAAPSTSTSSFTLFPLLPTELRIKIWELVAGQPRNVELSCTLTSFYLPEGRWFSHSKPPAIFHVCLESRSVATSTFSVFYFSPLNLGASCSNPIYINFEAETLWLCSDLHESWARDLLENNPQLKEKLKFIAVKESLWKDLNRIELTPSWSDGSDSGKEQFKPVYVGLKALENVRFHS